MQVNISFDTIKLILFTALLWSAVYIFSVVALCSIGYARNFYAILRPSWMLLSLLFVLWLPSSFDSLIV